MRLRHRDKRLAVVKKRISVKEADGTSYEAWEPVGRRIYGNIQPAGGRVMAEVYGLRMACMLTMMVSVETEVNESDGVCVFASSDSHPDYKVIAIRAWSKHKVVDLERIHV